MGRESAAVVGWRVLSRFFPIENIKRLGGTWASRLPKWVSHPSPLRQAVWRTTKLNTRLANSVRHRNCYIMVNGVSQKCHVDVTIL